jgi:hypothetical protein
MEWSKDLNFIIIGYQNGKCFLYKVKEDKIEKIYSFQTEKYLITSISFSLLNLNLVSISNMNGRVKIHF